MFKTLSLEKYHPQILGQGTNYPEINFFVNTSEEVDNTTLNLIFNLLLLSECESDPQSEGPGQLGNPIFRAL